MTNSSLHFPPQNQYTTSIICTQADCLKVTIVHVSAWGADKRGYEILDHRFTTSDQCVSDEDGVSWRHMTTFQEPCSGYRRHLSPYPPVAPLGRSATSHTSAKLSYPAQTHTHTHIHLLICAQACMSPVQLKPRRLAPLVYIEKSYRGSPFAVVMGYISRFLCASSTKGVGDKGMRERRSLALSCSLYIALPCSHWLWLSLQLHSYAPSMLSPQYNHSSIESCPSTEHLVTEYSRSPTLRPSLASSPNQSV